MLYIDASGRIHKDETLWQLVLDRVKGSMEDFLKPGTDRLKDHSMDRYVEYIKEASSPSLEHDRFLR